MATTLEPFRVMHLLEFTPRVEGTMVFSNPVRLWRIAMQYEAAGTGWTLRNGEGRVIACAGIYIEPEGVGTVWLIGSELIRRHRVTVYKEVRRIMAKLIAWFHLRRLHTLVSDGFPTSVAWLERLGFHREATLRKSGENGEDQHVYVRFTDGT